MFESEIISALDQVEQAAGSLWTLIDNVSFAEYENAHDDVASHLKAMRRSYASSLQVLHRLQEFQRTVCDGIEQFLQKMGRFENYISRTVLNYGLNLLPDEILFEIFLLAAPRLDEKVALSLVCKRFRRVMMSMRKMWDGYWMESDQPPEQIISIAEGNNFVSLKARICWSSPPDFVLRTWVADRGLDLDEYAMRYCKFSVGLILSFRPEELEIGWSRAAWALEAIEPILADGSPQNLRVLLMPRVSEDLAARLLEMWDMPHLQDLEVGLVPRATLARNLVRCNLSRIGERQFDSLKEFLAAAQSLQELGLSLSKPFHEVCDLPSLRSLEVNFEPHPSLARHLVQFQLSNPARRLSLSRLLNFLSSSEALQELDISTHGFSEDRDTMDALPVVTLPNVVSCKLEDYQSGPTLVAKLRMPMVRKLELGLPDNVSTMTTRDEFRTALQSMSSLEDLKLTNVELAVDDMDEIVRYAPPHLDSFSVTCDGSTGETGWVTSPVPRRKLIRFMSCRGISPEFMLGFIDYLRAVGLDGVKLQFSECSRGWREGTFELDDVMSAILDN